MKSFFYYIISIICLLLNVLFVPKITLAQSTTGTINVSAIIVNTVTISTTPLNFGTYGSGFASTATADVTITATNGTPYTVQFNGGSNYNADGGNGGRALKNGTNFLNYRFCFDSAHANLVPIDTPGDQVVGTGIPQVTTYYGQIPAGQLGDAAGSYTDTLVITVNF